jgi:hypothetical protein
MFGSASRTACFVGNIDGARCDLAALTATRNAPVTFSGSANPVVRLMTALPAMVPSYFLSWLRGV